MLTLSTLTLFVRDLCLSTVAPHSSARQRRCTFLGLFSTLRCDGQLFAPRVSRVPESLCTNCARLAAFVAGNVLFGQASFPDVQREFPATATFHRRAGASPWPFRHRLRNNTPLTRAHCFFFLRRSDIWRRKFCFLTKKMRPAKIPLRSPSVITRRVHLKNADTDTSRSVKILMIGSNVIRNCTCWKQFRAAFDYNLSRGKRLIIN